MINRIMEVQATTSVRRTSRFCSAKGKFLRLDLTINADPRSRFAVSFHNEISIRVRDVFAEPMCQPETRDRRFHFFFSELEPSIFRNPLVRINFSSLLSLSLSTLHFTAELQRDLHLVAFLFSSSKFLEILPFVQSRPTQIDPRFEKTIVRSIHRRPIERSSRISLLPFQKRQAVIKSAKGKFHPVGVVAGISSALSPALRIASQQFPSFQLARSFPPNCPRIAVGVLSRRISSYLTSRE